jgi:hypothetical protein
MIKKLACFIVVLAFFSFVLTNNFRELVLEKLNAYAADYPEKVYVQTDKPYYTTGEDIWYTAYLVNGVDHKRSNKSRVVYVELINEQDSVLLKKQLYTNDISVAGDFKIKKSWRPGNYILRAYTNYMRNKDADYFFQKEIPIWNASPNDGLADTSISSYKTNPIDNQLIENPEINFYPEGGYLINNINSKIGLKIKDKSNRNITVQGFIKDSDDNIVTTFSTYEFGLGIISLTPAPNKNYYASLTVNNQEVTYPLPKALPNGYSLGIVNNGNQIILKVSTNNSIGLQNSFLVAHQRGHLIFEKLETENKQSYSIKINTDKLLDGVTHFTLFDGTGNPVCERLAYIDNPDNDVSVNINTTNENPKTRDEVTLQINLKDKDDNNLSGNLSMSITDLDAVGQSYKHENIKTYLLLNSDLRGKIQDPGYFFEKENAPKRRFLLDLLMLTHGWRRFTWNALLYSKSEQEDAYIPEKGLYISGHTSALKEAREQIQTQTRLTFMGTLPHQETQQSNANGTFKYGPFVFHDSLPTLIEARIKDFKSDDDKKKRFVSIYLDEDFYKSPKVVRNTVLRPNMEDSIKITSFLKQSQSISEINADFLKSANILDEIVITAQKKTEQEERNKLLNERADYGYPTNRIDLNDMVGSEAYSIFDLLNTLPGVSAYNDSISIRGGGVPGIYLDGFQVQLTDISHIRGGDIEFIDVLKGADAAYFSNSGNGIIAIHSKIGSNVRTKNIKRKPGIIDFSADGFYTAREFYAPDHLNGFDESMKQDIRTTLHWEPKIILNSTNNQAEISFFTSDKKSKYAIKIEGLTDTGSPVYHLSTFEVE